MNEATNRAGCRRCGGDVYASGCPRCKGTGWDPEPEAVPRREDCPFCIESDCPFCGARKAADA